MRCDNSVNTLKKNGLLTSLHPILVHFLRRLLTVLAYKSHSIL